MAVFDGRYRGEIDGDFVVFIIGFRINKPWDVRRWVAVALAMPPMVREARADPSIGMLGAHYGLMYGCFTLVQYWRSFEDLDRYARSADAKHLPAWSRYNTALRGNASAGVFHETFKVRAGEAEAVYVDMPRQGLAAAGEHLPVGSTATTAALRIGLRDEDQAPVEP